MTRLLPWGLALAAAGAAIWFGVQAETARVRNRALQDQLALAEVTLKSAASQLEAERVVSARLAEQLAAAEKQAGVAERPQPKP